MKIEELTEHERAYLAGIIDLAAWYLHRRKTKERELWVKSIILCSSPGLQSVLWISGLLDGYGLLNYRNREASQLHLCRYKELMRVLNVVEPYLRFKKKHCALMKIFLGTYSYYGDRVDDRERINDDVHELRMQIIGEFKTLPK